MYFRVYHRRSRQPLATYDERQIVDFCMGNKDSIGNYSFSVAGSQELMEWEVFAVKYSHLFVQRAKMREQAERKEIETTAIQEEIREKNKKPLYLLVGVAGFVLLIVVGGIILRVVLSKPQPVSAETPSAPVVTPTPEAPKPAPAIAKRDRRPSDESFVGKGPDEKALAAVWDSNKKKKWGPVLTPVEIKEEMDKYLPSLEKCFTERAKAGDRGLKGTINMKIRVAGDGSVLDVLFTDEKYKATLFADCLADEIKSKKFRPFRSKEQVFSYYFDL